jgi:3-oxoacyl-[acyl-carrier-protein] synthase II
MTMERARRRVAVVGIGVVAPNGVGRDTFWRNLVAGISSVDRITAFDPSPYPCQVAAEVRDFDPLEFLTPARVKTMGRFAQFAVAAGKLALDDSGLDVATLGRAAVCVGTAVQGSSDVGTAAHEEFLSRGWQSVDAAASLQVTAHAATAHVQQGLGIAGPVMTVSSACCTGIDSIAWGAAEIRKGHVRFALVGATEAPLSPFIFGLFNASGHLSTWEGPPAQASRPYDRQHCGLVLGEGAAVLVLEDLEHARARGATVYAELLGYASAAEASSRHPEETYVAALSEAIGGALEASRLTPADLDYVCSHANSTTFDDRAEAKAHRAALDGCAQRIAVSSIKSMIGQPFAASGALQTAAAALAVHSNTVPPTINLETPDPDCDLDYVPNVARVVRVRRALVHSHSLGGKVAGSHSALVLGKA